MHPTITYLKNCIEARRADIKVHRQKISDCEREMASLEQRLEQLSHSWVVELTNCRSGDVIEVKYKNSEEEALAKAMELVHHWHRYPQYYRIEKINSLTWLRYDVETPQRAPEQLQVKENPNFVAYDESEMS